jgi:lipoprotein-anchoring transpeptidase ErfK/SrfK
MNKSIAALSLLATGLACAASAEAQTSWSGGTPVFESDVRARAAAAEAEREARRKAHPPVVYPKLMQGGEQPDIKPAEPPIVYFDQNEEPGSIIVDTAGKKLYYVLPGKKAYAYPISVGRDGFTWQGTEKISRIAAWPTWTPPPEMHKRIPGLPITVTGGLKNPQGARALYLGNTIYRIHGTNNDRTVGRANSSGCFRLTNEHVVHLASIAKVGTKVRVLQAYAGGVSEGAPLASLFSFGASEEPAKPVAKPKPKAKKPAPKKTDVAAAPAAPTAPDAPAAAPATTAPSPAPAAAPAAPAAASTETPARPTTSE